jgi:hypothetical protein
MELDYNSLPLVSKDIIARNDANGILLFQVYTDEMYFVTFNIFNSFITKCNGSQTLQEIVREMGNAFGTKEAKEQISQFVNELLERKIIELW